MAEHFEKFLDHTARNANGLERRFAGKFAVFYAAGVVDVESGLLPWPRDWPMRASSKYLRRRDDQIGFRRTKNSRVETLIARGRIHLVSDPATPIEKEVFANLLEMTTVSAGSDVSSSEQIRVRDPSGKLIKMKFWKLDGVRLLKWAKCSGGRECGQVIDRPED